MSYEQTLLERAIALTSSASKVLDEARAAVDHLQHSGPPSLELRYDDRGRIDELVGKSCSVHLEDLGGRWCLIVSAPGARIHLSVTSKEAVAVDVDGPVTTTGLQPAQPKPRTTRRKK